MKATENKELKSEGQDAGKTLSASEVGSLAEKINQFHNTLPEGQHQLLDALMAKGTRTHEGDVQGHWWMWTTWVSDWNFQWWVNECYREGGVPYFTGNFTFDEYFFPISEIGCWR